MDEVEQCIGDGCNEIQRNLLRNALASIALAEGSADHRDLKTVRELQERHDGLLKKMGIWQRILFNFGI